MKLGAGVAVGSCGVGVSDGVNEGEGDGNMVAVLDGGVVRAGVGVDIADVRGAPEQDTTRIRMNIRLKKRRMDLL